MMRRMEAVLIACALALGASQAFALGTPAGTVITSQATANYTDLNGNPLSALSNAVTTTVTQVAAVSAAPSNAANGAPSDIVYYAHTITNAGNGGDTIDLAAVSSRGWATALYRDVNGNGTYEAGTDVALADTDADGQSDTGNLVPDAGLAVLVGVAVPAGTADGIVDVTTLAATSSFNTGVSANVTDTTTIQSPVLSVVKSALPAGAQPPGTQLTYTVVVANGGSGNAVNVVLTDPVPANTAYVASSIQQDGAPRSDGADGDNADFGATNPGQVTVNVGNMVPGASTTVTFRVTID